MQWNSVQIARSGAPLFFCLVTGAAGIVPAQSAKGEAADITALRAEVQRLALELLQYRAELIQWKMDSIGAELQHVQAERQHLTGERQVIEREIGELNQASTNGIGTEEERREELRTVQLPTIMDRERAVTVREATLVAAFGAERARLSEIQKQVQRLTAHLPRDK
jgi:hypothetical protein